MNTEEQQQPPDPAKSEERVRQGCLGMAILLGAVTWVLILQTNNLAWSLLLLLVVLLLVARRYLV